MMTFIWQFEKNGGVGEIRWKLFACWRNMNHIQLLWKYQQDDKGKMKSLMQYKCMDSKTCCEQQDGLTC